MKRILAIVLMCSILLCGCADKSVTNDTAATINIDASIPEFTGLSDTELLSYVEDSVYTNLLENLNDENYFVERVQTTYISKEYVEELSYNSQKNIYFGYTLSELDDLFQDTRYVFTLGEDGKTTVEEFKEYDDSYERMIKNVAIGSGVILVCVTVSVVSAGMGAPAVSMIFAASATTAKTFALSSAAFGGISAGVIKGIQTKDFNEAIKAAALAGSEGFKWGAISGAIVGGTGEAFLLKTVTKNGLTMNEAAMIQADSQLPIDVISQLHSWDEYLVYKSAGLKPIMVNGKTALIQNVDLNYVSQLPDGSNVTNLARMQKGYAPLDPATGKAYQLHHVGQKADGTLAVLTDAQHQGNSAILNIVGKESEIVRPEFARERKAFWEYLGNVVFANGGIV